MKLNFEWKRKTAQYTNGTNLWINRIKVGWVNWNDTMSRDDPDKELKRYVGGTMFSDSRWYGATEEEVKNKVETYVTAWFEEALKNSEVIN